VFEPGAQRGSGALREGRQPGQLAPARSYGQFGP
jgi:hypothetical protein